ncbi:MAG TPA: BrnT family toxin [Chloroflexota bacterium]|nr:BrnT family toxin [Chloroflexota bacterium]
MQFDALEVDDDVLAKLLSKHNVRWQEVQDVFFSEPPCIRRGREGTYLIYGQTAGGRYLLVVVIADHLQPGTWRVVSARDMTDSERSGYAKR